MHNYIESNLYHLSYASSQSTDGNRRFYCYNVTHYMAESEMEKIDLNNVIGVVKGMQPGDINFERVDAYWHEFQVDKNNRQRVINIEIDTNGGPLTDEWRQNFVDTLNSYMQECLDEKTMDEEDDLTLTDDDLKGLDGADNGISM